MNRARLSYLIAAALVVAIVLLGWFGAISPQLDQISASKSQRLVIDSQNQALATTLATLKSQSQNLPELTKKLDSLRQSVPSSEDIDIFTKQLQSLATANGVELTSLTVSEATAYPAATASTTGTATGSTSTSTTATASPSPSPSPAPSTLTAPTVTTGSSSTDVQPSASLRANLYLINLSLSVSGPSAQITSFLSAVQTGTRLFLVTTASLSTPAAATLGTAIIGGYVFIVATPAEIAERTKEATTTSTATPSSSPSPSPSASASSSARPSTSASPSASASASASPSPSSSSSPTP